jgi:2,3-bisphosphoglycerate-independent phosphoglycerate mutase
VDAEVLGPLLAAPQRPAVLVVPDHYTPVRLRTHIDPPVPFAYAAGASAGSPPGTFRFGERAAAAAGLLVASGQELMDRYLGETG